MAICTTMQLESMKAGYTEMAKTKTKQRQSDAAPKPPKERRRKPRPRIANLHAVRLRKKASQQDGIEVRSLVTVDLEDLNPLLQRQFVVGRDIMVARVLMKKGCIIPLHSHYNEQFTYILEGALKFWIDGKEIVVNAGEVLTIPPHMPHKAEALVDTVDLDVFNPPRADWINKTDQYLRGGK